MQQEYASVVKISLPLHLRRQANLQLLVDEAGGVKALADLVESPRSHISALLGGAKACGNQLAAKIESAIGKEPGWLDADHGPMPAPRPASDGPTDEELKRALMTVRSKLVHAHGDASALIGEALRLLALTPDSDRAFSKALDVMLLPPEGSTGSVQLVQIKGPQEEPPSLTVVRQQAMRIIEAHPDKTAADRRAKGLLTDFLGMLDTVMRGPPLPPVKGERSKVRG